MLIIVATQAGGPMCPRSFEDSIHIVPSATSMADGHQLNALTILFRIVVITLKCGMIRIGKVYVTRVTQRKLGPDYDHNNQRGQNRPARKLA